VTGNPRSRKPPQSGRLGSLDTVAEVKAKQHAAMRRYLAIVTTLCTAGAPVLAACSSSNAPASTPAAASTPPPTASPFTATPVDDLLHSENADAYRVNVNKPDGLTGDVFYTVGFSAAVDLNGQPEHPSPAPSADRPAPTRSAGVRIATKDGHVVWGWNAPDGVSTGNFRTQVLNGEPVLTWWAGDNAGGHGTGQDYIVDSHYHLVTTLTPGDGLSADTHEFRLTPDGHALITSYREVTTDLSAIGGPKDGKMLDCVASVVDVATGKPLLHWDAMQHVPFTDSSEKYGAGKVWDPYHMNSIALDPAGNLLISLRHLSTVYDVNPASGDINWTLGGKNSTYQLGPGVAFAFQHDAQMPDPDTVTLFNNNSESVGKKSPSGTTNSELSSLKWIHLDPVSHQATLLRNQTHPDNLVAGAMGNLQQIGGGNTFSNWGTAKHISEFASDGDMLYDVTLSGFGAYRAYFADWHGMPDDSPTLRVDDTTGHAQWNGATALARWTVLSGPDAAHLSSGAPIPATGIDTSFALPKAGQFYQVEALDAAGAVIGKSSVVQN